MIFQSSILPIYAVENIDRLEETATSNQDGTDQKVEEQDTTTGDAVPEDTPEGEQAPENEVPEDTPEGEQPPEDEVPEDTPEGEQPPEDEVPEDTPEGEQPPESEVPEDTPEGEQPPEDEVPEDTPEEEQSPGDIPLEEEEEVLQEQTEEELQEEIQPIAYDAEAAENLKKEFSRNGNHVTQYENEEDKQLKTIVWAKGVTPPDMKSFKREEVTGSGGAKFVTYQAPYEANKGWYDVNKTQGRVEDANLCFAVAASNALHWWLEQNKSYIDRYLEKYPEDEKKKDLKMLRDSYNSQQSDSEIYRRYIKRYSKRPNGYWSDILVDEFINGYEPKENGGTNDESIDGERLLQKGPSKNGGFFYDIFGTTLLTRRTYGGNFQNLSNDLKQAIINGDLVLLIYNTKVISHVVTLWGAEYDLNGQISAVYLTDSDDETSPYAMVRYMVKNIRGNAFVSTNVNGTAGSIIEDIKIISLGEEIWKKRLDADPNAPKITLDLKWGNTEFRYDTKQHKPFLEATNVEAGDNVVLLVDGEQKDAGEHTATAVLEGASKDKYQLPAEHTKQFRINKARAKVDLKADSQLNQENKRVEFNIRVSGVNNEKPDGTITLRTAEEIIQDNIQLVNGSATYTWENLPLGNHRVTADFYPSADGVGKNYNQAKSNVIRIDLPKKNQSKLVIEPVVGKKFGDGSFTLQTTGGTGNGEVTYSCSTNDVLSINGSTATIIGAGSTTITAVKAGDAEYNSTTATYVITIDKAKAPSVIYPTATPIMYGQKLSESVLVGGSMEYGSFAWENGELVPGIHNTGYSVRFIPSSETLKNYETIPVTTSIVKVTVSRANPLVTLTTNIIGEKDSRKVTLSAVVEKASSGDGVTGTVNFVNCTGPQDTEIALAIPIVNGEATYTWTGMPEQLYKIKAVYSGDGNYNTASSMEISVDLSKDSEDESIPLIPLEPSKPITPPSKPDNGGNDNSGSDNGNDGGTGGDRPDRPSDVIEGDKSNDSTSDDKKDTEEKPVDEEKQPSDDKTVINQEDGSIVKIGKDEEGHTIVSVDLPVDLDKTYVTLKDMIDSDLVPIDLKTGKPIILSAAIDNNLKLMVANSTELVLKPMTKTYKDTANHWSKDAISFTSVRDIFKGTSEDEFSPDKSMTRGMIFTVLARVDGQDTNTDKQWYDAGKQWAVENGLSDGARIGDNVTREELVTLLYRYVGQPDVSNDLEAFKDAKTVSSYSQNAMKWAVEKGIISGQPNGTIQPKGEATRAQVASIMERFIKLQLK